MKFSITTLNTYNARFKDEYFNFLESQSPDIFCFQEINSGLEPVTTDTGTMIDQYYQTRLRLPEYYGYHNPRQDDWVGSSYDKARPWGNAVFVKKNIKIVSYREDYMLGFRNSAVPENLSRTLPVSTQTIVIEVNGEIYSIVNFHGYYAGPGVGKRDNDERLLQSKNLCDHLTLLPGKRILVGDFNLDPDTESIEILEKYPLRNLVKEYGIKGTRTKEYPEEKRKLHPYADYVFVEDGIHINGFHVDTEFSGSDHAPLFLEIEI